MQKESTTPMLRQYLEIKRLYPGTILFFRLGDFYEMFNEDAIIGSRELQITLTARHKESPNPVPMCGVPHHAAAGYIAKLVKKGYRVAICEQAEAAGKGVKLVKREVVRVITPGTAVDEQLLDDHESAYLASVSCDGSTVGAAFLDLSTGEFRVTEVEGPDAWDRISEHFYRFDVREVIVAEPLIDQFRTDLSIGTVDVFSNQLAFEGQHTGDERRVLGNVTLTPVNAGFFELDESRRILTRHFEVNDLAGFGLSDHTEAIKAAGACIRYVSETQRSNAGHISSLEFFAANDFLVLDAVTVANLELVRSRNETVKRTLFDTIDHTVTGMGGRLLRTWLLRPLIKRSEIATRLSAVDELLDLMTREKLRFLLKNVQDLERLIGRLNLSNLTARDLLSLKRSLDQGPKIRASLTDARSLLLQVLSENVFDLPDIRDLIERAIADEPPPTIADGGTIRTGFNVELDDLRSISSSVKQTIAAFEESERERTSIINLKVRFNNVFGYFIEVSKGNLARVPDDYERRQTLSNAERFTTPQLKEWESKVLGAEDRILKLEAEIFGHVRETVRRETQKLQSTARAFATLDVLAALAETAQKFDYVRPAIHDGDEIEIKSGRHPVVERALGDSFVPNDLYLNNSTDRLLIITGPNMGGKSTILRQVALIQILAQIGSFVPATSARLPVLDRIWTRVGASDDLASGRSTFMVEMTETAAILHNASPRSLILLDEIGRGTSTFDGLSIAWAVAEYLHDSPSHSAKTLFATHYHELTELAEKLPGAKNYQMTATERDGDVVFLHRLVKGKASKSYGIAVAKLAGLPRPVIERAKSVLAKLEQYELAVFSDQAPDGVAAAAGRSSVAQFTLFDIANKNTLKELLEVDPSELTLDEAAHLLQNLKQKIM